MALLKSGSFESGVPPQNAVPHGTADGFGDAGVQVVNKRLFRLADPGCRVLLLQPKTQDPMGIGFR